MTHEGDQVGKLIRQSGKGPLGFAESDQEVEPGQVIQTEVVEGRETKVNAGEVRKEIHPKARAVVSQVGLKFIPGGIDSPIGVDDLRLLLNSEQAGDARNALKTDRKRRKKNLQAP